MDNGIQSGELLTEAGALIAEPMRSAVRAHSIYKSDGEARSAPWETGKRLIDFLGSAILIALLSPLFLIIGAALYFTGGNILFRQTRVGRDDVPFVCYKFRTMVPDADRILNKLLKQNPALEEEWLRTQKLTNDPRTTLLGRFLRKTSLDELPQLFNVFNGSMSLVGPRPVLQQEILRYGRAARWYLSVRPGMTGLWQVCRTRDTDYARRVAMDTYYVRNSSLRLDIWVILRTFSAIIQKNEGS